MEAVFVPFSVHDGRFNMDFDEKMLDFTIKTGIPVAISNLALTDRKVMTRKRAL